LTAPEGPRPAAAIASAVQQLDVASVVKASQALSGEIALPKLIERLMTIALENGGADRGLLILMQGDTPRIEAAATTDQKSIIVTVRQEVVTPAAAPESLLYTVIRMRQSVILNDARAQNPFSADSYIREKNARSVLCLPLLKQTQLIGVLYLENNLASHVFTPTRISLLELLASQAAISLENARLYGELTMSEERWRQLFESVPVGIGLIGPNRLYVATNPAFRRMTGYSEAELHSLSPIDITHGDDRTASEAIVAASIAGGPLAQRVEKRYRRKDGGITWAEVSLFPALMVGSARQLGGIAVDITERKRAEEALSVAQTELAHAARLTTLGQLTASIAHEVNQPLAAVLANAEACLLWLNRDTADLDGARRSVEWIIKDCHRAVDVIQRIRALMKKSDTQRTPLDVNDVVNDSIALVQRELLTDQVSLRMELAPALPVVLADRVQLQQVIINLVINGIQAMQSVADRPRELGIRTQQNEAHQVVVTVKDCGIGISAENAERLFGAFFTTKSSGTGMGLSICRSIVEAHGGRVWAEPNLPHGATFHFTVPLYQEDAL